MLSVLIKVSTWLQFVFVTDSLTFDGAWHFGEVLHPGFSLGIRWCHVGERFADVNVVDLVADGSGGVMVPLGIQEYYLSPGEFCS